MSILTAPLFLMEWTVFLLFRVYENDFFSSSDEAIDIVITIQVGDRLGSSRRHPHHVVASTLQNLGTLERRRVVIGNDSTSVSR